MQKILTPNQMRQAEAAAEKQGISLWDLMLNAGTQLADIVFVRARQLEAHSVLILCGKGNNGGDGYVCAAKLAAADPKLDISICQLTGAPKTDISKKAYELAKAENSIEIYGELSERPIKADIIVDCVFGTGFHGELDKPRRREFEMISNIKAYKIACDLPSGVDSLRGTAAEGTCVFDETVSFHAPKLGTVLKPARAFCGKMTVCDIGIPGNWTETGEDKTFIREAESDDLHKLFPVRPEYSYKGTFGKLLIIAGSENYIGAAAVCSRAALRTGCGIVNLAAPMSVIQAIAGQAPECVYTPLPKGDDGCIGKGALPILAELIKTHDAIVVGCGLGQTEGTKKLIKGLIKKSEKPLVIDADGINLLAKNIDVLREKNCEMILTPHMGELGRLAGISAKEALASRYDICRWLTDSYGVTLHSKDSTTLTFSGSEAWVTNFGCSALAKGGSGDMLTGIIGSMLAQGASPAEACMLGSYIMGRTAEMLCEGCSPAAITASDIINEFKHSLTVL